MTPVVTFANAAAAAYTEAGAAEVVGDNSTVTGGTGNYNGGLLQVSITQNRRMGDRIGIQDLNNVTLDIDGRKILINAVQIGTIASGLNGGPLTVVFNADATTANVQTVLRNVTFSSVSTNPTDLTRTLTAVVQDVGVGGGRDADTEDVDVTSVNDAPTLNGIGTAFNYRRGAGTPPQRFTALGNSITDPDSTRFAGFTVELNNTTDTLALRSGGYIRIDGGNVLFGGQQVGTVTTTVAGGTTTLTFTFDAVGGGSNALTQIVLRHVAFASNVAGGGRTLTYRVTDIEGTDSADVVQNITVV